MNQIKKLLRFVRPYRRQSILALIMLVSVAVLDLAIPRLVQRIIDQGILAGSMLEVRHTFFIMLIISIVNTAFSVGNNIFSIQAGEGVARDLREALFDKIQSFSFGNLDRLQTGQLMVRLSSDTSVLQRVVQITLRIGTRAPLIMIGSIFLMFATDRTLALTMVPLLLVTIAAILFFVVKMRPLFLTLQQKLDRLNTVLQENIAGVRVVKAFALAAHESVLYETENQNLTERSLKIMEWIATMGPMLRGCINIGIVVVVWSGGLQAINGDLTTGEIVAFVNYLQTALGPLIIMGNLANVWAAGLASAERVVQLLEDDPEVLDCPQALALPGSILPQVVFEEVSFNYHNSPGRMVLEGINFTAEPGQTVAILGATGAGKSTLVNLIPRFYDVTAGRIMIHGNDIRQIYQDSLLSHISVVPQETVLFSGTIRDNIRYGKPQADQEDVNKASQIAQAQEFILGLPNGFDTHLEERGVNLSGGQKQRIAIARALLTSPDILILDDSTSSVDVETEANFQFELKKWLNNRTCFIVAQRISTVLKADLILVIDQGKISGAGTHRSLLLNSPIYQEIYQSQLGNGINGV